jgi:hypothetical protein
MIDTPKAAAAEIRRLAFPAAFRAVWRSEWRQPHAYFQICHDLSNHVPALRGLCPLWEQNGEAIIGCLVGGRFIRFYYEDASLENPDAAIELLGANYQQFATSILTELVEAGLWDDYEEVAGLLSYKYARRLRTILEHDTPDLLARFRACRK